MTTTLARPAGSIFMVVAPSGAGKSTLVNGLLARDPGIELSISTRRARRGPARPAAASTTSPTPATSLPAAGAASFLEWAEVHGHYYGTSRPWIEQRLAAGRDVLLEIDWQGARQVGKALPQAIGIFILPPSIEALEARLHKRGQDSPQGDRAPAAGRRRRDLARARVRLRDHQRGIRSRAGELGAIVTATRLRYAAQLARHRELFAQLGLS